MQNNRVIKYIFKDYLIMQADKNPAVKGRASLTHELIKSYGLLKYMHVICPKNCDISALRNFHNKDYVELIVNCTKKRSTFVKQYSVNAISSIDENDDETLEEQEYSFCENLEEYGLGFDCPLWLDIEDYVCTIAGATMSAAALLCKNNDIKNMVVINWNGGWHHAHIDKAAGYCYVNDVVLGILLLRKHYQRVLYLDLDVHHGDGVQEAFETTKRVFTLSFHKYECGFYPGTGASEHCGAFASGKGYTANFPYYNGIGGENYRNYFKRVTSAVLASYKPDVCVVQCGADALVGDPLGGTNIVPDDIIDCVSFVLKYDLPTLLLGGGGYHFTNASRLWTLLTAHICKRHLADDIPDDNPHFLAYGPDYSLHIESGKFVKDLNTTDHLENCAKTIEKNLLKYNVSAV